MSSTGARLNWGKLLSDDRLPAQNVESSHEKPDWLVKSRTETERDFDRILFAAPTRRLGDKTQVFPLEKNESVRTRLTHSHEVANLARSIGTHIINSALGERIVAEACNANSKWSTFDVRRAVPAILAAVGLAHDLGNPPFGHQGEEAIREWIRANERKIFFDELAEKSYGEMTIEEVRADIGALTTAHKNDFLMFEGNAQTIRTVTRLQVVKDNRGLNLTFGTLAALMKYTASSGGTKKEGPAAIRKIGHFASEASLVQKIREATGLAASGIRHPLTYIMDACDDIAFLIVDAEDAIKKQIVSFHDLIAWLRRKLSRGDDLADWILAATTKGAGQAEVTDLPPDELSDVSMQIFRANAITAMVSAVITAFENNYDKIMTTGLDESLIKNSTATAFAEKMKEFDIEHAYKHRRVLEIELDGYNTIHSLMDMLWRGITERQSFKDRGSRRTSPFARYAYGRISENYRRVFEGRLPSPSMEERDLPIRYLELQLLTDMIAGMTDQYAIDLHRELQRFNVGASKPRI